VPQSFIDEMRNPATLQPKGMVTDAPAVAAASMSDEKKESLMARLRQAISDEEECSVSQVDLMSTATDIQICFDILRRPKITDCGHLCKPTSAEYACANMCESACLVWTSTYPDPIPARCAGITSMPTPYSSFPLTRRSGSNQMKMSRQSNQPRSMN
jgi:hypothetical protein